MPEDEIAHMRLVLAVADGGRVRATYLPFVCNDIGAHGVNFREDPSQVRYDGTALYETATLR